MKTNKDLRIHLTKTTVLNVPSGAEVIEVSPVLYAIKFPHNYLEIDSDFCRHDASHYYAYVKSEDIDTF